MNARGRPGGPQTPSKNASAPRAERGGDGRLCGANRAPDAEAQLGKPRLHLRRCDSTNLRARELASAGAPHGTLVTAGEQTAGRGRQGRSWLAPAGECLLCSLVLRGAPTALLPLLAGVALCDALGGDARLKWPNDVVRGERLAKLAGILVEARPQDGWAVVGIGVNVALRPQSLPADLRASAATLGLGLDAIEPLLAELLRCLQSRLREPHERALARWRELDALRGRSIEWAQGRGTAEDIDGEGRLLVRSALDGGVVALNAGDVHLSATG